MYQELLSGYAVDPVTFCTCFDSGGYTDLVVVGPVTFHSLCEHHVIPFYGSVTFGYVPDGRMLGLSKFGRVVDALARRLQTQEHLTRALAETIWEATQPAALIVEVEAEHFCMAMRGVRKPGTVTRTSEVRGRFTYDQLLLERYQQQLTRR